MFQQISTIARNTFTESIRQPVYVVVLFAAILALIIAPSLAAYTLDNDNKLLVDMGLSTLFLTGLLLAAFTATGVLADEIEKKTVLTVVSKPVGRPPFVIGKYVGVAGALAMAYWILTTVFLLTVRHRVMQTASDHFDLPVIFFGGGAGIAALLIASLGNYFYRWVFTSTVSVWLAGLVSIASVLVLVTSKSWAFQSPAVEFVTGGMIDPEMLKALVLIYMAILILAAVAIAASTRLGQIMTLLICIGVFMLGLVSQYMLGRWADENLLMRVLYRITPNFQYLWSADALTQEHTLSAQYIVSAISYSLLMIASILSLAVALFQTREVG